MQLIHKGSRENPERVHRETSQRERVQEEADREKEGEVDEKHGRLGRMSLSLLYLPAMLTRCSFPLFIPKPSSPFTS